MKVGMSTACLYGRVYNEQALVELGKMGVVDAEIFFSSRAEYGGELMAQMKRTCKDEGIKIHAVHALPTQFEPQLFSGHARQFEDALEMFDRVIKAGAELGADIYVFHGPIHVKIARKLEINFPFAGERVSMLAERAKQYGIALCYENVHWCWYKMPGFAKELLRHCASDNLFFTLDMKQAAQSGYGLFEYIDDMGSRLKHIHVCDYEKTKNEGIQPRLPFKGETDWEKLRATLQQRQYKGMLMLEVYARDYDTYDDLHETYMQVKRFFEQPVR